jgi:hypothetical protein
MLLFYYYTVTKRHAMKTKISTKTISLILLLLVQILYPVEVLAASIAITNTTETAPLSETILSKEI